MPATEQHNLPKTIWFLWLQGFETAPQVIRECYQSWTGKNPGWNMILLNDENLAKFVEIERPVNSTNQAWSDLVRINLLANFGGVWVDATCFCVNPLDEWLPDLMTTGFFAFNRPGPGRMISSWFIASFADSYIAAKYKKAVNTYWRDNPDMKPFDGVSKSLFKRRLRDMEPQKWFSYVVIKVLKLYPYFWFHYLFEYIYLRDGEFKTMWDATPKLSADGPHALQSSGLLEPASDEAKKLIDGKKHPVYKLTWKYDDKAPIGGTLLEYLFEKRG